MVVHRQLVRMRSKAVMMRGVCVIAGGVHVPPSARP